MYIKEEMGEVVEKIEEIYARTRNEVKVGEKEGEWF
jgi:hypothetical protein